MYNSKLGAIAYNTTHSLIGALVVLIFGYVGDSDSAIQFGLIWCAHIGFDRALGYGLKYTTSFNDTHLGKIGLKSNT